MQWKWGKKNIIAFILSKRKTICSERIKLTKQKFFNDLEQKKAQKLKKSTGKKYVR
jgi:hypothetical protein